MRSLFMFGLSASAILLGPHAAHAADSADAMRRLRDPDGGLIVIAHRGCHAPAPQEGLGATPENSLAALEQCVKLGVEIMETDVRRTRDGYMVMVHDETVDRTTDGHGKVSDLTLESIKSLRLRQNLGGANQPLTNETVPTLDELLARAKGRILLNLDVKDPIYAEVIDAVARAGMREGVIVKTSAGVGSQPLAAMSPYDRVPFAVIPATSDGTGRDLPALVDAQMAGSRHPVSIELPIIPPASLAPIAERTRALRVRLWVNTLFDGFVQGGFGDVDALRDPDAVWGRLYRMGVSVFQTDEPAALVKFRKTLGAPERP